MSGRSRGNDMRRLDIAVAARNGWDGQGSLPLAGFERLCEGEAPVQERAVAWSAHALERLRAGVAPEVRLRLEVSTAVDRTCQRCLQPVRLALEVRREFLFVAGEGQAAALDAENEQEDVLELTRHLDLHALIEDELLLALPLVPRHERCPQPLVPPPADLPDETPAPNPFAALARLRRGPGGH